MRTQPTKEPLMQQTLFGTPTDDERAVIIADLRGHLSDLADRVKRLNEDIRDAEIDIQETTEELNAELARGQ